MYKDLGTIMVVGSTGSGKSTLLRKYINEVVNKENNLVYIIDPKRVEFSKYMNLENVVYINCVDDIDSKMLDVIKPNENGKTYIFIDEYAEIKWNEELHKKIKNLIYKRDKYNLEFAIASQLRDSICNGMRKYADAVILLNRR